MSGSRTIRKVLDWATADFRERGIESPRLDAELLVGDALGLRRVQLYLDLDRPLTEADREGIRTRIQRRRRREPVAYIVGRRGFYGRSFVVDPSVLVPRPDTEVVVESALGAIEGVDAPRALDLCTGSGIIGLSLAAERSDAEIWLTDLSEEALAVARRNAAALELVERCHFAGGDLFDALDADLRFDLVVSNPPYVPAMAIDRLAPEITRHEPRLALDGGSDGLDLIRRIAAEAPEWMREEASIVVEIGDEQAESAEAIFASDGRYEAIEVISDYGGSSRALVAKNAGRSADHPLEEEQ